MECKEMYFKPYQTIISQNKTSIKQTLCSFYLGWTWIFVSTLTIRDYMPHNSKYSPSTTVNSYHPLLLWRAVVKTAKVCKLSWIKLKLGSRAWTSFLCRAIIIIIGILFGVQLGTASAWDNHFRHDFIYRFQRVAAKWQKEPCPQLSW